MTWLWKLKQLIVLGFQYKNRYFNYMLFISWILAFLSTNSFKALLYPMLALPHMRRGLCQLPKSEVMALFIQSNELSVAFHNSILK